MGEHSLSTPLRLRTRAALSDSRFRHFLGGALDRYVDGRSTSLGRLDGPDDLRAAARAARLDSLARLPDLIEVFIEQAERRGVIVHVAETADEACALVDRLLDDHGARSVVKGKSMVTEEIGLNAVLEARARTVVETDLGERIIQLAGDIPSHIIAPALHKDRYDAASLFSAEADSPVPPVPETLAAHARERLRQEFLRADAGITGANFLVASTGSVVLVENEGNGRLTTTMPRVHIAVTGIERVTADWEETDLLLNLLARSSTGQQLTSYTNVINGGRADGEDEGPESVHVVLVDNGRSEILASELHEMLSCIRCGACLNHCPVYRQVGGHAYGWVYSGPMGAVFTPLLGGHWSDGSDLANASTLCGACMDACPVGIPIQDLLLKLRQRRFPAAGRSTRFAWAAWAETWSRPATYRASVAAASRLRSLAPLVPAARRWAEGRELPLPADRTFRAGWAARG